VAAGIECERDRATRRGAASGALDRPAWCRLHGRENPGERGLLGLALGKPDVAGGHGAAVPLGEAGAGPLDQRGGVGELAFQLLLMGMPVVLTKDPTDMGLTCG